MLQAPIFILIFLISFSTYAQVRQWSGDEAVIREDLNQIIEASGLRNLQLDFSYQEASSNTVKIKCEENIIKLLVAAEPFEKVSTVYHGVFKLGFLFPHPRIQISPRENEVRNQCGKTFNWKPAFSYRGFHLHTLHPNEWVKGFLEGQTQVAIDTVRWHARNRQNAMQLTLLRGKWKKQIEYLKEPFALAKALGISRGISNGAANQQQNHWQFIPLPNAISGIGDETVLRKNLNKLHKKIDFDFYSMEFGTSEFTAVNYERALRWMEITSKIARGQGKMLFAKIHVSTNQHHTHYGNFNFLARYSSKTIGLFPHTVMFYGLYDEKVPMYGNENFSHMLQFIREEKNERKIWYFPETSYWIGMDMDVPLLLTDYLLVRATDMKNLHEEGIEGHMNFSTGHEIGYWLFDWTIALNADLEQNFDPYSGLKLLNEEMRSWEEMANFQHKHFKEGQLIATISAVNIQDELSKTHRIHHRYTIKELAKSSFAREEEILKLETAIAEWPGTDQIRNPELRKMLEVTYLRMEHALCVRRGLRYPKKSEARNAELKLASEKRMHAMKIMTEVREKFTRYPESNLWERDDNLTSYNFNYLWTAGNLHFWKREEEQIRKNNFNPFFLNIYNILDILL